ncbi:MAG: hypothetical protein ACP5LP_04045 [Candidatus Micrarchaeia archaeon]
MKRLTKEQKDKIMQLHNEVKGVYAIAKELGLVYEAVVYYVKPEFREKIKARSKERYLAKKSLQEVI